MNPYEPGTVRNRPTAGMARTTGLLLTVAAVTAILGIILLTLHILHKADRPFSLTLPSGWREGDVTGSPRNRTYSFIMNPEDTFEAHVSVIVIEDLNSGMTAERMLQKLYASLNAAIPFEQALKGRAMIGRVEAPWIEMSYSSPRGHLEGRAYALIKGNRGFVINLKTNRAWSCSNCPYRAVMEDMARSFDAEE